VRGRESEKLLCTWREACKAADYVLEHFGDKSRDRGIWIWYCRRIGLDVFLDIADEVGSSKIGAAYTGEDVTYIESPYSQTSIVDFHNNIVSIRNAYMGGVENARDESKSIHNHVKNINAALDTEVQEAIEAALAAIDAMPAPFVNHISDARNGAAMEACAALSEKLDEVVDALRNN